MIETNLKDEVASDCQQLPDLEINQNPTLKLAQECERQIAESWGEQNTQQAIRVFGDIFRAIGCLRDSINFTDLNQIENFFYELRITESRLRRELTSEDVEVASLMYRLFNLYIQQNLDSGYFKPK